MYKLNIDKEKILNLRDKIYVKLCDLTNPVLDYGGLGVSSATGVLMGLDNNEATPSIYVAIIKGTGLVSGAIIPCIDEYVLKRKAKKKIKEYFSDKSKKDIKKIIGEGKNVEWYKVAGTIRNLSSLAASGFFASAYMRPTAGKIIGGIILTGLATGSQWFSRVAKKELEEIVTEKIPNPTE